VALVLLPPDGIAVLQPDIGADHFVQHLQDLRVIDQDGRRAAGDGALRLGQGERVVADAEYLVADRGDLVPREHTLPHQIAGEVKPKLLLLRHDPSAGHGRLRSR
jgi:hypothetical protein